MSPLITPFATGPVLSAAPQGEHADWTRNFAAGRLIGLALAFCVAPFVMILPGAGRDALPILVAALASGVLGLVAVRLFTSCWSIAAAGALGLCALGAGLSSGLSPATVALAALALVIDHLAMPQERRSMLSGVAGLAIVSFLVILLSAAPPAGAIQAGLAALILPLPAVATMALQMRSLRGDAARQETLARHAARRERTMVDAADAAIVIVEQGGRIVDATAPALLLLSCDAGQLAGRGFVDRVLIADRPAFLKAVSDVALEGRAVSLVIRMASGAGHAAFVLECRRAGAEGGQVAIRIAPDVAVAHRPPDAVDRAPLFAALSHEVRTPVNAILGFSEMLANPALCPRDPEKIAEYARIIHRSAQSSFAVTRAVVDLLRVESTPFSMPDEPVDAAEMLRAAIAQVIQREPAGQVAAQVCGEDGFGLLHADPRALRMLFGALVEGLSSAVGGPARIDCRFGSFGLRPEIEIEIVPASARPARDGHSAFLGVVTILCRRIADAIGAELTLAPGGQGWRARLLFAIPASVTVLRPAAAETATSTIVPLRKSA